MGNTSKKINRNLYDSPLSELMFEELLKNDPELMGIFVSHIIPRYSKRVYNADITVKDKVSDPDMILHLLKSMPDVKFRGNRSMTLEKFISAKIDTIDIDTLIMNDIFDNESTIEIKDAIDKTFELVSAIKDGEEMCEYAITINNKKYQYRPKRGMLMRKMLPLKYSDSIHCRIHRLGIICINGSFSVAGSKVMNRIINDNELECYDIYIINGSPAAYREYIELSRRVHIEPQIVRYDATGLVTFKYNRRSGRQVIPSKIPFNLFESIPGFVSLKDQLSSPLCHAYFADIKIDSQ